MVYKAFFFNYKYILPIMTIKESDTWSYAYQGRVCTSMCIKIALKAPYIIWSTT